MPSSLLSAIVGVSMILSGHSHHGFLMKMDGDYQEKNNISGVEISTTLEDPIAKKFFHIKGSKASFYYKNFINSENNPSESFGVNVEIGRLESLFKWRFKYGYTWGIVQGYKPQVVYQDDKTTIRSVWAPYALAWGNVSVPLIEDGKLRAEVDVNAVPTAFGWQCKMSYETKF